MNFRRLIPFALAPLLLAACDEAAMGDLRLPWDKTPAIEEAQTPSGPPAVSPLENPIELPESSPVAMPTAEASTLNETAFTAEGPGGAWRVQVEGNKALFMRHGARDVTVDVRRLVYARGVEYVGMLGGAPWAITILGGKCTTEGMPRGWTMGARLKSGGSMTNGCAAPAAKAPERAQPAPQPAQPANADARPGAATAGGNTTAIAG